MNAFQARNWLFASSLLFSQSVLFFLLRFHRFYTREIPEKIAVQSKTAFRCAVHMNRFAQFSALSDSMYAIEYMCWAMKIGRKGTTNATRYFCNGTHWEKKIHRNKGKVPNVKACGTRTHTRTVKMWKSFIIIEVFIDRCIEWKHRLN